VQLPAREISELSFNNILNIKYALKSGQFVLRLIKNIFLALKNVYRIN